MEDNFNKRLANVDLSLDEFEEIESGISHGEGLQLITFILGDEKYGLDILKVKELISFPEGLTHIPGMPDFIEGMFNLRGLVIPVMDLRKKFELSKIERNPFSVVIIVYIENKYIGLIVDAVSDVIFIKEDKLQETSEMAVHIDTKFIKGLAKTKDEMIILLDIDYLLSKKEFEALLKNKNES